MTSPEIARRMAAMLPGFDPEAYVRRRVHPKLPTLTMATLHRIVIMLNRPQLGGLKTDLVVAMLAQELAISDADPD